MLNKFVPFSQFHQPRLQFMSQKCFKQTLLWFSNRCALLMLCCYIRAQHDHLSLTGCSWCHLCFHISSGSHWQDWQANKFENNCKIVIYLNRRPISHRDPQCFKGTEVRPTLSGLHEVPATVKVPLWATYKPKMHSFTGVKVKGLNLIASCFFNGI